ncbi:MAG: nuclear transport factor 2 family protein [Cyclobacteriaceae bacterium]|nr:nuclear transport factor 2 family protein [Cyclobacteriaceae bacterium]
MKRTLTTFFFFFAAFITSYAQVNYFNNTSFSEEKQEILEVVLTLFDGMREGDSAKVHSVFRNYAELYTSYTNQDEEPILLTDDLQKFLKAVGTPHDKTWDEPIWDIKINMDNNIASLWTKYAFYLGNDFSHCGIDAFMLNKDKNGWKIFHLTDTRQKNECSVLDEIKKHRE